MSSTFTWSLLACHHVSQHMAAITPSIIAPPSRITHTRCGSGHIHSPEMDLAQQRAAAIVTVIETEPMERTRGIAPPHLNSPGYIYRSLANGKLLPVYRVFQVLAVGLHDFPGCTRVHPSAGRRGIMRKTVIITAVAGSAAAAAVIWSAVPHGHTDYRDPVQLARAVKDAEHSTSASCGKLPAGKYLCVAANADGSSGTYTVTVAADGKSYTVS